MVVAMVRRREKPSASGLRHVDERPITQFPRRALPTPLASRLRLQLGRVERSTEKIDAEHRRQRFDERDVAVRLRAARAMIDRRDEEIAP